VPRDVTARRLTLANRVLHGADGVMTIAIGVMTTVATVLV
jgi:hypothetical protein